MDVELLVFLYDDSNTDAECAHAVQHAVGFDIAWSQVLAAAVHQARPVTVRAIAAQVSKHGPHVRVGVKAAIAANNGMVHVMLTTFRCRLQTSDLRDAVGQSSLVDVALLLAHGVALAEDDEAVPVSSVPGIAHLLSKAARKPYMCPCPAKLPAHETAPVDSLEVWGLVLDAWTVYPRAQYPYAKDSPLFAFCKRLLVSDVAEENLAATNALVKKCHKFVVWHLEDLRTPLPQEVQCLLCRLFLEASHGTEMFMYHHGGCSENSDTARAVNGTFGRVPLGGASCYFVDNLNWFGSLGGFDLMISRIEQQTPVLPLEETVVFLKCITRCRFCFTKDAALRLVPRLQHAVAQRVMALVDTDIVGPFRHQLVDLLGLVDLRTILQGHYGKDSDTAVLYPARDEQHVYLDHVVWLCCLRRAWMTACVAIALDAAAAAAPTTPLLQCMLVRHSGAGMCIPAGHLLVSEHAGLVAAFL